MNGRQEVPFESLCGPFSHILLEQSVSVAVGQFKGGVCDYGSYF